MKNRSYELTIETNDGGFVKITPPFTLMFTVVRSISSSLNTASFQIIGLSKKTRGQIFQDWINPEKYKSIVFKAGYGDKLSTLFKGNMKLAYSERQGTEISTIIEAWDGGYDIENTLVNKTFAAGTTKQELMDDLTKNFTYVEKGIIEVEEKTFVRPIVVDGSLFQVIKKYADGQTFIDLEKLHILKENGVLEGEIPIITSSNGLLSTPQRQDSLVNIKTMFMPQIIIGQVLEVKSDIQKEYNGQFKVLGCSHSGIISEAVNGNLESSFDLAIGSRLGVANG